MDEENYDPQEGPTTPLSLLKERLAELGDDQALDLLQNHLDEEMKTRHAKEVEEFDNDFDRNHAWRYDDPTGQDADSPEIEESFRQRIAMQDRHHDEIDPEGAAERRYFEAAANYFP